MHGDAAVRAVGTLTRTGGDTVIDSGALKARDVTWRELRDALDGLLADGLLEVECRLVTESFVDAIDERIAPAPPTEDEQRTFVTRHEPLLDEVASEIARLIRGTGAPKRIRGKEYFGWRIPLPGATDAPLFLRLYLSQQNTRLNFKQNPDSLIVGLERDPNGRLEPEELESVKAVGFTRTQKDIAGYDRPLRRTWPVDSLDAVAVAGEIAAMLVKTGLLLDGIPNAS